MSLFSLVSATATSGAAEPELNFDDYVDVVPYVGTSSAGNVVPTTVDLSGGGLIFLKNLVSAADLAVANSEMSGVYLDLSDSAVQTTGNLISQYSNGSFTLGSTSYNVNGSQYLAYVFRKAPGFLDIITYTGDGSATRIIPHSLGAKPILSLGKARTLANSWRSTFTSYDSYSPYYGGGGGGNGVDSRAANAAFGGAVGCGGGGGTAVKASTGGGGTAGVLGGGGGGSARTSSSGATPGAGGSGFGLVRWTEGGNTFSTLITSTSSWTVPSGVTSADVWVCGGGAGGSIGGAGTGSGYGGGGGGGALVWKTYALSGGSISFVIGAGGTAGTTVALPTAGGATTATYSGVTITAAGGSPATTLGNPNGGAGGIADLTNADGGVNGGAGGSFVETTLVYYGGGGGATAGVSGGSWSTSTMHDGGSLSDTTLNLGDFFDALERTPVQNEIVFNSTGAPVSALGFNRITKEYVEVKSGTSGLNSNGVVYVIFLFSSANEIIESAVVPNRYQPTGGTANNFSWKQEWPTFDHKIVMVRAGIVNENFDSFNKHFGFTHNEVGNSYSYRLNTATTASATSSLRRITHLGRPAYGCLNAAVSSSAARVFLMAFKEKSQVPTAASTVFDAIIYTGNGASRRKIDIGNNFDPDIVMTRRRSSVTTGGFRIGFRDAAEKFLYSTGSTILSNTSTGFTSPNAATAVTLPWVDKNSYGVNSSTTALLNALSAEIVSYAFRQAPGFFKIEYYTGTGANQQITHKLGAVPEMIWIKSIDGSANAWLYWHKDLDSNKFLTLDSESGQFTAADVFTSAPTSTTIDVGANNIVNQSGQGFIVLLFASVPGVCKVGTYTGDSVNGVTIPVNFPTAPAFVAIRAASDTSSPYFVWDSARGITNFTGSEPSIKVNSTDAEVIGSNSIDPYPSGPGATWQIDVISSASDINTTGVKYLYYAIAS